MKRRLIGIAAVAALWASAGCTSAPPGEVKLGVSVAPVQISNVTDTTQAGSEMILTRVRLLVAHAKIGYIGEQPTGASAEVGPIVVELSADEIKNGARREFSLGELPGGTYGGAEIEIEPLDAEDDQSDPAVADFVKEGASVLIDGTYQGKAFHFAGHFLAEQGTDGDVTVDAATPVALDMSVDTSTWFLDANGAALDPTDATQHQAQAIAICKTLDTQPQLSDAPGTAPAGHGGKGGKGGGGRAHCVER